MDILQILIELLPYSPLLIVVVIFIIMIVYWEKIRLFIVDFKTFIIECMESSYISKKISPAIQHSLSTSSENTPLLRVFKEIIPVQLKIDKNAKDVETRREKSKILMIIPSKSMDNVVKAIARYFSDDLSQLSVVRDYNKLERALELFCLESVINNCKIDGALKIAGSQFINNAKEDEETRLIFDILADLNSKLGQVELLSDIRLLRILVVETCRGEFSAIGRLFM